MLIATKSSRINISEEKKTKSIAKIFAKKNKDTTERKEKTNPTASAVFADMLPEGMGLNLVLSIFESIIRSCHILRIADPEAPIAISNRQIPFRKIFLSEGARSIAHKAVKITRDITPGLIKTYICFKKFRIDTNKILFPFE